MYCIVRARVFAPSLRSWVRPATPSAAICGIWARCLPIQTERRERLGWIPERLFSGAGRNQEATLDTGNCAVKRDSEPRLYRRDQQTWNTTSLKVELSVLTNMNYTLFWTCFISKPLKISRIDYQQIRTALSIWTLPCWACLAIPLHRAMLSLERWYQIFYVSEGEYNKATLWFKKPINTALIIDEWDAIQRIIISLQQNTIMQVTLVRKLSRHNQNYPLL